jgi:hypothetical protein
LHAPSLIHYHFYFPAFLAFIHCSLPLTTFFLKISSEADQSSNHASKIPNKIPATTADSATAVESEDHLVTSYSTMDDQTMAKKEIPTLHEYWKAPTMTNEDITAYHEVV